MMNTTYYFTNYPDQSNPRLIVFEKKILTTSNNIKLCRFERQIRAENFAYISNILVLRDSRLLRKYCEKEIEKVRRNKYLERDATTLVLHFAYKNMLASIFAV